MEKSKEKRAKRRGSIKDTVTGVTGFSPDIFADCPHITMFGNREITVGSCEKILEYTDKFISIKCGKVTVTVSGGELTMAKFSGGEICVTGILTGVEFG